MHYLKKLAASSILFLAYHLVVAQTPQFAVVRPDGTTYICPSFDSAYNKATNGDNIYLPGGNFSLTNPISKSLHIYGAGYNQDSSAATNITTLTALTILQGADFGSIEGVVINALDPQNNASLTFGDNQNQTAFSNYTIKYCSLNSRIAFLMPSSNITICDNCIGSHLGIPYEFVILGYLSNSLISNNIIFGNYLPSEQNSYLLVKNNIFFWFYGQGSTQFSFGPNSTYENNIFQAPNAMWSSQNSNFYNNTNGWIYNSNGSISSGTVTETFDLTFINPGTLADASHYYYDVHNDYHIKPTSLCKNSGTDGTDRGIYGGAFPWKEGSVPSNPHIYFKQVAGQTNSSGQLQIQFKVRTDN
jgi:hypothetical protein